MTLGDLLYGALFLVLMLLALGFLALCRKYREK